jgi:RNA polymerase sigma-70 factor (ECF subfamily)
VTVAARRSQAAPDRELALAAATGDADAFAELYARYADRVFARITHLIGPGPEREDVLQQVFLELHRALPRFRGDSSLSTFLYRIAINVTYDHLRRRTRRSADHDPAALDTLIDGDPTPEDRARRREELVQIFALLDRIKPNKRIAFVLVAVEGLSLGEAAELVGAHPDAVKQRVLHARRELFALLQIAERRVDRRLP